MRKQGRLFAILSMAALAIFLACAQTGAGTPPQSGQSPPKSKAKTSAEQDEGEKKFQQNCSRCHDTPEGFSSRISGTVVRHMRVRASLSKKDAEAILHFLNP